MNTGNGFVIYRHNTNKKDQKKNKIELHESKYVVGTGFDKIVLQVAMQNWKSTKQNTNYSPNFKTYLLSDKNSIDSTLNTLK